MWNNRFTLVVGKKSNRWHLLFSFSSFVHTKPTLQCCQFIDTKPTASVLLISPFSIYWLRCCHSSFDSLLLRSLQGRCGFYSAFSQWDSGIGLQLHCQHCKLRNYQTVYGFPSQMWRSGVMSINNSNEGHHEREAAKNRTYTNQLVNERSHLAGSIASWCHRAMVLKPLPARPSGVAREAIFIGKKS